MENHSPSPYPWNPSFCSLCQYPIVWHDKDFLKRVEEIKNKPLKTFTNHEEHMAYYYPEVSKEIPCSTNPLLEKNENN